MGGQRLDPFAEPERVSVSELIDSFFEEMLVCGMPSSEFWDGEARLAKAYIGAYRQRREEAWYRDWLMGQYHMAAISACLSKDSEYPREPWPVTEMRERDKRRLTEKREADGLAHMQALMASVNARKRAAEKDKSEGGQAQGVPAS